MARLLFSCVARIGHFRPLVPLARACVEAGHDVAFVTSASFADHVEAAGFSALPAGISAEAFAQAVAPFDVELRKLPVGERRPFSFASRFAAIEAPAKLDGLRSAVAAWQPDLLVYETADLAAPLVAALTGIPSANHSFGRNVPGACLARAALAVDPLWRRHDLEPEPFCGVFRGTYIDICPPSLQGEVPPGEVPVLLLRPTALPDPGERLPSSVERLPDRPTVYVTLGTVFNDLSVFRRVLDGLAALDCNVVATVGTNNDPEALGRLPANAVVERYIAQSLLLPRCALTVGHGGSGSVLAALAEGLPLLLVPQGADQFENAEHLRELGAARVLMPDECTPVAVRDEVADLLAEPSYREAALGLAGEIAAMPAPAEIVPVLARLAGR